MLCKLLLFILTLSLFSCATNKGGFRTEEDVELQIFRMTMDEILADLGNPDDKVVLSNGNESWRYESEVGGLTGGECTLTILFSGETVKDVKLSANDLSWVSWPLGSCTKIIQTLKRGH